MLVRFPKPLAFGSGQVRWIQDEPHQPRFPTFMVRGDLKVMLMLVTMMKIGVVEAGSGHTGLVLPAPNSLRLRWSPSSRSPVEHWDPSWNQCEVPGNPFEETFENAQWRKVKQMQPAVWHTPIQMLSLVVDPQLSSGLDWQIAGFQIHGIVFVQWSNPWLRIQKQCWLHYKPVWYVWIVWDWGCQGVLKLVGCWDWESGREWLAGSLGNQICEGFSWRSCAVWIFSDPQKPFRKWDYACNSLGLFRLPLSRIWASGKGFYPESWLVPGSTC